jgi:hypothetical protein
MSPTDEKHTLPPSYTESTSPSQSHPSSFQFPSTTTIPLGQSLLDSLTLTRSTHIASTISTHILPLISSNAQFGIAVTTLALLPSDSSSVPPVPEKSEYSFNLDTDATDIKSEVIGFASDETPTVVRLEGPMNRAEFWRIGAVVGELERVLRERLNESATRSAIQPGRSEYEEVATAVERQQGRRGIWGKLMMGSEKNKKGSASASKSPEGGTMATYEVGSVHVACRLEEVCLRTVSEFGLYDTMTTQCVIVRVDAKC